MRTRVGIVGAGPAGLLLSHLLHRMGVDSVVLERHSRDYVRKRVRAGVLEYPTTRLLREVGVGTRMDAEGLPHKGISLRFDGADHRIDFEALTGKHIVVYGQQKVVADLIAARDEAGGDLRFGVSDVAVHDIDAVGPDRPSITFTDADGRAERIDCDVIAGCDGSHGVTRDAVADRLHRYEHDYPFAWLGILAKSRPPSEELIYTSHTRGFALASMRSPELTRLYLQVPPDTDIEAWPDEAIWQELRARLAIDGEAGIEPGEVVDRTLAPVKAFVAEPMRHGNLFLAGDAAHTVPPTGAKGMNLAIADVVRLSGALEELLLRGRAELAGRYSQDCLRRVWRAEHFSWFMSTMLHPVPGADDYQQQLRLSQLRYTAGSTAAATSLAENYVGLPF